MADAGEPEIKPLVTYLSERGVGILSGVPLNLADEAQRNVHVLGVPPTRPGQPRTQPGETLANI